MGFTASAATDILSSHISANTYVGLSTTVPTDSGGNFTEPSSSSGYERSKFGEVDTSIPAQIANKKIIFFNESLGLGYGEVSYFGLFNSATGSTPFFVGHLETRLTIGAGYVPIFRAHQLIIGLDKAELESYG